MSTIKVDTIQKNGGASEISIDKLGGVTAAGSMLVVGEGGTNTTNLQQGLCKAFAHINQTGPTINNSFNIASHTDSGTGISDTIFIINQANVYFCTGSGIRNTGDYVHATVLANNGETDRARAQSLINANTGQDSSDISIQVAGDLA
jgi:hypothetical protein